MQSVGAEPRGLRVPPILTAIVAAVAIAVGLTHAIEVVLLNVDEWRADIGMGISPGWVPLATAYHLSTIAVGIAIAFAVVALAPVGKHRALRVLGAIACVAAIAELAIAAFDHGLAATLIGLAATAIVGGLVASGRLPRVDRRAAWIASPVAVAAVIAVGWPGLALAWADRTASHRNFVLGLHAAYGPQASAASTRTKVVFQGKPYEIEPGDAMLVTGDDIGAIRLDGTMVDLHITNGARARELMRRSRHRLTMLDALYVDGEIVAVPRYQNVVGPHVAINFETREAAESLARRLAEPEAGGGGGTDVRRFE